MARAPRETSLETRNKRLKLAERNEPYWRQISEGLFLGYRRSRRTSTWICRQRIAGKYVETRVGKPDDFLDADDRVVFTYSKACELVRGVANQTLSPAPKHHGDGLTINDCWELYREGHLKYKPSLKDAEIFWQHHVQHSIGPKLVMATSAEDYRKWLRALSVKPPVRRGKIMAFDVSDPKALAARAASANRVWTIVKAALTYAKRTDKLETDRAPWLNVQKITVKGFKDLPPKMLEEGEISRLLDACTDEFRPIVTAALMTGARYDDLCTMKVSAFNPETKRTTIPGAKNGNRLHQPLNSEGFIFFKQITDGRDPNEYMFTTKNSKPWGASMQKRRIDEAAQKANLADISFKITRATYGKLLLLATRDIEMVAKALGHSDTRVTRKHYAQYLPNELEAALQKMPTLIKKEVELPAGADQG